MFSTIFRRVATARSLYTKLNFFKSSSNKYGQSSGITQQNQERIFILPKSVAQRNKAKEQQSINSGGSNYNSTGNTSTSFQGQQNLNESRTDSKQTAIYQENQQKDDDVHSRRFLENLKLENGGNMDDLFIKERKELHKFTFEEPYDAINLNLDDLNNIEIENKETFHRVPKLEHQLDSIVHQPGIYSMDEMAKVQPDGGKFLRYISQPQEIDMNRIPDYIPPSQDKQLMQFAKESNIKFVMSTSTISNVLSQIFYMFSSFRNPSFDKISNAYDNEPKKYMISQRKPITNFLRRVDQQNDIYALDGDPGLFIFRNIILMDLGKIIEKQLTMTPEQFNNGLLKTQLDKLTEEEKQKYLLQDDHHRFMKLNNDICLRSQIDCHSYDPVTKKPFVFEIKTRTVCPMRYDLMNYSDYFDYNITQRSGLHSSYEREYYDLIRGAFLKYAFQLRIGRMDGAFISYHNTRETFGFEYIKRIEIDRRIFGNQLYAEAAFVICSKLLTTLLNLVIDDLKKESFSMLKIGFYSCSHYKKMTIFTELFDEQIPWGKENLIEQSAEIKDEFDYFTKYTTLKNRVYKYEFTIYPYINGVYQKYNNFTLNPGDQLNVKYKFKKLGKANFLDYMNFLHEAYKFESINLDLSYVGAWVRG